MKAAQVYVGIGSNIEPRLHICSCLDRLATLHGELTRSRIYRNPPVGFEGADFCNLVVGFRTGLPPEQLQYRLREIERRHGRCRRGQARLSSRTLDLDLLLYGDRVDEELKLPHPDILNHAFVLRPLAEIAGDLIHPVLGMPIGELWAEHAPAAAPALRAVNL